MEVVNVARHLRSADTLLEPAVRRQVDALDLGERDAGAVALALALARSIDEMDADTRGRMIGQTSGALLKVLDALQASAAAQPAPRRDSPLTRLREARAAQEARRLA